MEVYVIILKNNEVWFDDLSQTIDESRHDALVQWGSQVEKVITAEEWEEEEYEEV